MNAFYFNAPHRFFQTLMPYFVCCFYFIFFVYIPFISASAVSSLVSCSISWFKRYLLRIVTYTHSQREILHLAFSLQMHFRWCYTSCKCIEHLHSETGIGLFFIRFFFTEDHFWFVLRIWKIISKQKREAYTAEELMLKEWYGTFTIWNWEFDVMSTLG